MASEVDICNIALSHLGDNATIASINPPEGSVQAEHCQRFYPIARDTLLEMHSWNFATKRIRLNSITESGAYTNPTEWNYVYQLPADCNTVIGVLPKGASDDYSENGAGEYSTQKYQLEVISTGEKVIRSDTKDAELRYVAWVTDTTKFSSLFTMALTWNLASLLAGAVIKGDAGSAEGKRCAQMMATWLGEARSADAKQRNIKPNHIVGWISGR